MKSVAILLVLLLPSVLPAQQEFETKIETLPEEAAAQTTCFNPDYLVHAPTGIANSDLLPLVIYLHGAGGVGRDIKRIKGKTGQILNFVQTQGKEPAIIVAPQCLKKTKQDSKGIWRADDLNVWLKHLKATLPIDENRIYLTGTSMGGYGTWVWAASNPEHFAAAAPLCGGLGQGGPKDVTPDFDRWAKSLATIPLWAFHGGQDKIVPTDRSERMVKAIQDNGGQHTKLTVYPDLGHSIAKETYTNAEFYHWMLNSRKSTSTIAALKLAEVGELLFEESFDSPDLTKRFQTGTGDWSIRDGALRGQELKSSHHSAFRKLFLDHQDVVYQVHFKIQGDATARLMINYELVHLANCFANKHEFTFTKLAEAKKRKQMEALANKNNQPIEQGDWQEKPIKFSKTNPGFNDNTWYTLTVELVGDEALAHLDGQTIYAKHAGLKERKTNFGLQAVGLNGSVTFDNLKVWSATEAKGWAKQRGKY